jgi:hypothetical protein
MPENGIAKVVKKKMQAKVAREHCEYVEMLRVALPEDQKALAGEFVLKGAVLLKPGKALESCQLVVSDKAGERVIDWGLPSPKIAGRFPHNPLANTCRFSAKGIRMAEAKPVTLWLNCPDGERHKLATIGR